MPCPKSSPPSRPPRGSKPPTHWGYRSAPASRRRSCARWASARTGQICASTARCSRSSPNCSRGPGVHYLSGFFGPLERALRDIGADIEFAPADFRRFGPLLERQSPRVMTTVATPPDADGWCSLSLHAGGTIGELRRAGADPDRLLVVEVSDAYPRTFGLGEQHRHALHVDEIDILVRVDRRAARAARRRAPPTDVDRAIARHAVAYIPSGATLQTGIGSIPNQIATLLGRG